MPRCSPPHGKAVPAATRAEPAMHINSSPNTTCNIRTLGRSACTAEIPAAASTLDNTTKHPHSSYPPGSLARPARPYWLLPPPTPLPLEQPLASRPVSRPVVYSTSPCFGKACADPSSGPDRPESPLHPYLALLTCLLSLLASRSEVRGREIRLNLEIWQTRVPPLATPKR